MGKQHLVAIPLQLVIPKEPFQQWGLDFIKEFKENSSNGFKWILIGTDYFNRWVEAIPMKREIDNVVKELLEEIIVTRFCVPTKITTDNAKEFNSTDLSSFGFDYGNVLSHSSNYYQQENGLEESSNKYLMTIIMKIVGDNKRI
jgi:hypothetical protein